jgi:hypothetical protein
MIIEPKRQYRNKNTQGIYVVIDLVTILSSDIPCPGVSFRHIKINGVPFNDCLTVYVASIAYFEQNFVEVFSKE